MIRLEDMHARIEQRVPALAGRVENAANFALLVEEGHLPQAPTTAFILPGGLSGGAVTASAGAFVQNVQNIVMVVLVIRVGGDPLGARAVDQATPIALEVIGAVAGWSPDDAPGVWKLGRAELVGAVKEAILFQIDFVLDDQLRIT